MHLQIKAEKRLPLSPMMDLLLQKKRKTDFALSDQKQREHYWVPSWTTKIHLSHISPKNIEFLPIVVLIIQRRNKNKCILNLAYHSVNIRFNFNHLLFALYKNVITFLKIQYILNFLRNTLCYESKLVACRQFPQ